MTEPRVISPVPEDPPSVNFGMTADEVYEHLSKVHGLGSFPRLEDEVLFLAHEMRHERPYAFNGPLFAHEHARGEPSR